jgi:hypothetical protein
LSLKIAGSGFFFIQTGVDQALLVVLYYQVSRCLEMGEIGRTIAYLHLSRKVPDASDELNIKASCLLIMFAHFFKILLQISSNPVEFLDLRDVIILITSTSVTGITFLSVVLSLSFASKDCNTLRISI